MSKIRVSRSHSRRDSWVEVNLAHLEYNCTQLRQHISNNVEIMAVVKADAYGHGADMVAPVMLASGIDSLGVASIDEGIHLRNSGIDCPILVLGPSPTWALDSALSNNLTVTVFSEDHLKHCDLIGQKLNKKFSAHLKIDVGMHRIGLPINQIESLLLEAQKYTHVYIEGLFSHLPCAEDKDIALKHIEIFDKIVQKYDDLKHLKIHIANSFAALAYPQSCYNLIRCGIVLYGLYPEGLETNIDLKEAMALRGRITNILEIKKGEGISYGYSFINPSESLIIATIPIGYADGVARLLSNNIYGLLNGCKIKQVGTITMDQMMFDITGIPEVKIGNIITLLGQDQGEFISIEDWAQKLDTINYEITCRLKVRLPRIYVR